MIFNSKWMQPVVGLGTAAVLLLIAWAVYGGNVTNKAGQPVASGGAGHFLAWVIALVAIALALYSIGLSAVMFVKWGRDRLRQ